MASYLITGPDGRTATVVAPEGVSEAEAMSFAQENWSSWENGGRYAMERAAQANTAAADLRRAEQAIPEADAGMPYDVMNESIKRRRLETQAAPGMDYSERFQKLGEEQQRVSDARVKATGEIEYGDSPAYNLAKPAAATAGFMVGGPIAATAAESVVRGTALYANLDRAIKQGAMTEDQAADQLVKEMTKGVAADAAFNFGLPLLLKGLQHAPGAAWVAAKVKPRLEALAARARATATQGLPEGQIAPKGVGGEERLDRLEAMFDSPAPELPPVAAQNLRVLESRQALATTPAEKQAVAELQARMPDHTVTPGQITGKPSPAEFGSRVAHPTTFREQEAALDTAAEGMRRDLVNPATQPARAPLGQQILDSAGAAETAVKTRLRPVFQQAETAGVAVDLSAVAREARVALARDAVVPGGKLSAAERADLEELVTRLDEIPMVGPEAALAFISRQKEKLRGLVSDVKPTGDYERISGKIVDAADSAFTAALRKGGVQLLDDAGKPTGRTLASALDAARKDYREVIATAYDDAFKVALRRDPEGVVDSFLQTGNVSRVKQLNDMLRIARREGTMTEGEILKMQGDMTRAFLQRNVKTVQDASKWTETLNADPMRRDTWRALTDSKGGQQLVDTMSVLESAAKMASRTNAALGADLPFKIALSRAAQGGLGISFVTGTINAPMALVGLSIERASKMAATAYTSGNKGLLRDLARFIRASSLGTPAAIKTMQELAGPLEKFAQDNGIETPFTVESQQ